MVLETPRGPSAMIGPRMQGAAPWQHLRSASAVTYRGDSARSSSKKKKTSSKDNALRVKYSPG